jgi:RimJ/RimL family protein N-acetyltransferase
MVRFLSSLAEFWHKTSTVQLDLSACTFLNAEGAAILAAFALHRRELGAGTEIDWDNMRYEIRKQLGRWQMSELFGQKNFPWTDNAIPLLHQGRLDGEAVERYVCTVTRPGGNMPEMTPCLVKEANRSLCELFGNIFEHAESPCGGLAIGQYYPHVKQVQICVCDLGVGLAKKVQRAGHATECCGSAIRWALEEGNSTKTGIGGLGLFMLQDFVKTNRGSLRILANSGYYDQSGTKVTATSLQTSFPGTLVQIGLLIRPNEVYTIQDKEDRF